MRIRHTQMSIAQRNRILQAIKRMFPEEYPVFSLIHETGLRPAEALALTTEDFTPDPAKIFVPTSITKLGLKSRHSKVILLPTDLGSRIGEQANRSVSDTKLPRAAHSDPSPLFVNPTTGKRMTSQHLLHNVWEPVLRELGIGQARMIDLRHASVIRQFKNWPSKTHIAKMLGHPPKVEIFLSRPWEVPPPALPECDESGSQD